MLDLIGPPRSSNVILRGDFRNIYRISHYFINFHHCYIIYKKCNLLIRWISYCNINIKPRLYLFQRPSPHDIHVCPGIYIFAMVSSNLFMKYLGLDILHITSNNGAGLALQSIFTNTLPSHYVKIF